MPLSREVRVELRKMFDTRSGFWLMASIAIAGLAATIAVVAFAPDKDLTYYTFTKAIGFPITVILPMIALLSITSEWSQRSGLTTFTLVPDRQARRPGQDDLLDRRSHRLHALRVRRRGDRQRGRQHHRRHLAGVGRVDRRTA